MKNWMFNSGCLHIVQLILIVLLINACSTTEVQDDEGWSTAGQAAAEAARVVSEPEFEEVTVTANKRRPLTRRERLAEIRQQKRLEKQQRVKELQQLSRKAQLIAQRGSDNYSNNAFDNVNVVRVKQDPSMIFKNYGVNPTVDTLEENTSTFSIDVDTASYNLTKAFLQKGAMPDPDSIRVEEFVNSFDYNYASDYHDRFTLQAEAFPSPHRSGFHVLHVGLKANPINTVTKFANLTLLIDVSGSMAQGNRMETVKQSLKQLVGALHDQDTITIISYSDDAQLLLKPTNVRYKRQILSVINRLHPQNSTNAEAGLQLAYTMANKQFDADRVNRIILCSDGVANVGTTDANGIMNDISKAARKGIHLTTVGVGMGNYNDVMLEKLAEQGEGQYTYINSAADGKEFFIKNLASTLQVVARDVKIQLEFDSEQIEKYRLVGYENRALKNSDFLNAKKDAGEVGANHTVTAIYEIKFRSDSVRQRFGKAKVSYKNMDSEQVYVIEKTLPAQTICNDMTYCSSPTQLSYIVAAFAEKLRGSYWSRTYSYDDLIDSYKEIKSSIPNVQQGRVLYSMLKSADKLDKRDDDPYSYIGSISRMDFDHVPVLK